MNTKKPQTTVKGFTLVELLIVIAIIGFLAAAILVAVDPVRRIQDARDTQRWSETNAILNAILKQQVDDRALYDGGDGAGAGSLIISHATNAQFIINNGVTRATAETGLVTCEDVVAATDCPGAAALGLGFDTTAASTACKADLGTLVSEYLAQLPVDPSLGNEPADTTTDFATGYFIHRNASNRITIGACNPEQTGNISVRR